MIEEHLIELLRPLIREVVREELRAAGEESRWVRVEQAAAQLGLTPKAIYHRVERGQLEARRLGRTLYIDMASIDHQLRSLP